PAPRRSSSCASSAQTASAKVRCRLSPSKIPLPTAAPSPAPTTKTSPSSPPSSRPTCATSSRPSTPSAAGPTTLPTRPATHPKPLPARIHAVLQDQHRGPASDPASLYQTWDQLLDYCARSANPVGRIVLTLGGYPPPDIDPANAQRYAQSDATCTALQLINFW